MSNQSLKKQTPHIVDNIEILYEDAHSLVINKPAGLMVHSDGRNEGRFLTDWIVRNFPKIKDVGEPMSAPDGTPVDRSGIVHRLDRETSGVLIVAKTQEGHAHIKRQFQDRTVVKKYLAFVWGEIKEEFGTINRPIGRSGSDFRKWSAQRGMRGEIREAETYWTRVWTGVSPVNLDDKTAPQEKFSLICAEPKTGRTHQIRVHLVAVHHPVVADTLYAEKRPKALGFERLALHSWSVEFENAKGERLVIKAPLPKDFGNACLHLDIIL